MNERIATLLFLLSRELAEAAPSSRGPRCHNQAATKSDLEELECRLTNLIQNRDITHEEKAMLDGVLAQSKKLVLRLEKLDQATPSK